MHLTLTTSVRGTPAAIHRVNNSSNNNNNRTVRLKRSLVEATAEGNFLTHPPFGVKRLSMTLIG
jgi:hypothetical protein